MKTVHSPSEIAAGPGGIAVAMGVFDGLHLGHQSVIAAAATQAREHGAATVVVTFDRHPNAVVAPAQTPPFIYPQFKKLAVLAGLGVDTCCVIRFDKDFSQVPAADFIRGLAGPGKILRAICVGEAFKFGHQRGGDVALLAELGRELDFTVRPLPDVLLDGAPVSSTRVREAVRAGQWDAAGRMLGRPYTLCGEVMSGAQAGRRLGFPTANLNTLGAVTPPAGVYAATATVGKISRRAAVNIGHRPTLYSSKEGLTVEAHLLDFTGDLYGQDLELQFAAKLREEAKFPSLDALRAQIARDVEAVRRLPSLPAA